MFCIVATTPLAYEQTQNTSGVDSKIAKSFCSIESKYPLLRLTELYTHCTPSLSPTKHELKRVNKGGGNFEIVLRGYFATLGVSTIATRLIRGARPAFVHATPSGKWLLQQCCY